jgi:hypothetical protein
MSSHVDLLSTDVALLAFLGIGVFGFSLFLTLRLFKKLRSQQMDNVRIRGRIAQEQLIHQDKNYFMDAV